MSVSTERRTPPPVLAASGLVKRFRGYYRDLSFLHHKSLFFCDNLQRPGSDKYQLIEAVRVHFLPVALYSLEDMELSVRRWKLGKYTASYVELIFPFVGVYDYPTHGKILQFIVHFVNCGIGFRGYYEAKKQERERFCLILEVNDAGPYKSSDTWRRTLFLWLL